MIADLAMLTILGMACATYATRVAGYLILKDRQLSVRARAVMDAAPGCVLVAAIAPHFVSPHTEELLALLITALAAWRLPMLATVFIGVSTLAILKHVVALL